jgi:hypothetical protein
MPCEQALTAVQKATVKTHHTARNLRLLTHTAFSPPGLITTTGRLRGSSFAGRQREGAEQAV